MQENPKKKVFDVTQEPMIKKYITYAVPLILISALQQSFNTADSIIIGKCASAQAFGGISATSSLFAILMSLFSGLSLGVSVTVSQAIGEKDYKKAGEYARTSVLVAIVGGLIMAAVTIPLSRPLFILMDTPKENLDYAVNYMRILASGAPIILLYNYGGAILRALGDTKKPLIFLAISGCVNVLLNYILIAVFHLNTIGAAVATLVSNGLSALLIFTALSKGNYMFNIKFFDFHFDFSKFKEIVKIGVPSGVQSILLNMSGVVVQSTINSFGAAAVSGNGIANSIINYAGMMLAGLYGATTTFVAQNFGARKFDRVKYVTLRSSVFASIMMACFSVIFVVFREPLAKIFIDNDTAIIKYACTQLTICTSMFFVSSVGGICLCSVQGMGKTMYATMVSLFFDCFLHIVWVYTIFRLNPTLVTLYMMSPVLAIPSTTAKIILYNKLLKSHTQHQQ